MTPAPSQTLSKLSPEEIKALVALLDRAPTKGIREAELIVHLVRKLNQMLKEATDEVPVAEETN